MSGDIVSSNGKVPPGSTECADSLAKQVGMSSFSLHYAGNSFNNKCQCLNQCYIGHVSKPMGQYGQGWWTSSFRYTTNTHFMTMCPLLCNLHHID